MGNNITNKLKYKESVVKFSYKYGWISEKVKAINKVNNVFNSYK